MKIKRRISYVIEELRKLADRLLNALYIFMSFLNFTVGRTCITVPVGVHQLDSK